MRFIPKPFPDECPAYSEMYMSLISDDGQVLQHLADNFLKVKELLPDSFFSLGNFNDEK
jgi:hypothetical protein